MTTMLRQSSINLYESHWQKFVAFRQWKGINVFNVRSQLFYQYLVELFEDNTAPSTMILMAFQSARYWNTGSTIRPQICMSRYYVECSYLDQWFITRCGNGIYISCCLPWCVRRLCRLGPDQPMHTLISSGERSRLVFWWTMVTGRPWSFIHAQSVAPAHITFGRGDGDSPSTMSLLLELGFMVKNQLWSQISQWATFSASLPSAQMTVNICCVMCDNCSCISRVRQSWMGGVVSPFSCIGTAPCGTSLKSHIP